MYALNINLFSFMYYLETTIFSEKISVQKKRQLSDENCRFFLASLTGIEPVAFRLGGGPSILLRYRDKYAAKCGGIYYFPYLPRSSS